MNVFGRFHAERRVVGDVQALRYRPIFDLINSRHSMAVVIEKVKCADMFKDVSKKRKVIRSGEKPQKAQEIITWTTMNMELNIA